MRNLAFLVLAAFLAATSARAQDANAEANRLLVDAVQMWRAAETAEPDRAADLLAGVRENLDRIVEDYPESNLAVRIALGEPLGPIDLDELDARLASIRVGEGVPDPALLARLGCETDDLTDCFLANAAARVRAIDAGLPAFNRDFFLSTIGMVQMQIGSERWRETFPTPESMRSPAVARLSDDIPDDVRSALFGSIGNTVEPDFLDALSRAMKASPETAIAMAMEIDEGLRDFFLDSVATQRAMQGRHNEGLRMLPYMSSQIDAARTRHIIAGSRAAQGDIEGALAMVEGLPADLRIGPMPAGVIIGAAIRTGDPALIARTWALLPSLATVDPPILGELVMGVAISGDPEALERIFLDPRFETVERPDLLLRMSTIFAQVRSGDLSGALDVIDAIDDPAEQAAQLHSLASALIYWGSL